MVVRVAHPGIDNANGQAGVDPCGGKAGSGRRKQATREIDGDQCDHRTSRTRPGRHPLESDNIGGQEMSHPPDGDIEERRPGHRGAIGKIDVGIPEQERREIGEGVESPAQVILSIGRGEDHLIAHEDELEAQASDRKGQQHQAGQRGRDADLSAAPTPAAPAVLGVHAHPALMPLYTRPVYHPVQARRAGSGSGVGDRRSSG